MTALARAEVEEAEQEGRDWCRKSRVTVLWLEDRK